MAELVIDIVSGLLLLAGGVFGVIGGIGVVRFPDFYTRMHAAGITDSICALLIVAGLVLQSGFSLLTVKLLLIFLFLVFTAPTAGHALTRAAIADGIEPKLAPETAEGGSTVPGEPPSNT